MWCDDIYPTTEKGYEILPATDSQDPEKDKVKIIGKKFCTLTLYQIEKSLREDFKMYSLSEKFKLNVSAMMIFQFLAVSLFDVISKHL